MVGPRLVYMMDEISTGLDSSTTFQIIQSLRHLAHLQRATVCVALLQPAPEVFDLFDDIMVLAEGGLELCCALYVLCMFCLVLLCHGVHCSFWRALEALHLLFEIVVWF